MMMTTTIEEESNWSPEACIGSLVEATENILTGTGPKRLRGKVLGAYTDAYGLERKDAETLYKKVAAVFQAYCGLCRIEFERSAPERNLETYCELWKRHVELSRRANNLLAPLDKVYCNSAEPRKLRPLYTGYLPDDENVFEVADLMRKYWSDMVLEIKDSMSDALMIAVDACYGGGQRFLPEHVRDAVESLVETRKYRLFNELELYQEIFEVPMSKKVSDYYRSLSMRLLQEHTVEEYVKLCYSVLESEREFVTKVSPPSVKVVCRVAWNSMVLDHSQTIIDATRACMQLEKYDVIKAAYTILRQSGELMKIFYLQYQTHEEKVFSEIVESIREDSLLFGTLLKVYDKEWNMISNYCESNTAMIKALNDSFREVLNRPLKKEIKDGDTSRPDASRIADRVVDYCDKFLRKGKNGLSDVDVKKYLDGVVTMFKHIIDKDAFDELYANALAKRLIRSTFQSTDAEEVIAKKLELNGGGVYFRKLGKLLSDYKVGRDDARKFNEAHGSSLPYTINVLPLQSGLWPISTVTSNILVPREFEIGMQLYNKFYVGVHAHRKLIWNHNLSTCDVKLNYLKKSYVMHTTVTTMAILASFDQNVTVTVSEILQSSDMGLQELLKYLQWLLNQKFLKSADVEITDNSVVSLNDKYENEKPYFKLLPNLTLIEEKKHTAESVVKERRLILQALIVKIMKRSKTISHKDLINEVVRQSTPICVPEQTFIQGAIQLLIDREYMKRREESDVYEYLA